MPQSKKSSALEAVTNTAIGFVITLAVSPAIYWLCDVHMKASQMGGVTFLFTVISVVRSYVLRRWFNSADKTPVLEEDGTII